MDARLPATDPIRHVPGPPGVRPRDSRVDATVAFLRQLAALSAWWAAAGLALPDDDVAAAVRLAAAALRGPLLAPPPGPWWYPHGPGPLDAAARYALAGGG